MDKLSELRYILSIGITRTGAPNMTTMITELYDALVTAGAGEDKARKAAETVASYENRFNKIEGDLNLIKWMVGANVGLAVGILMKMLV